MLKQKNKLLLSLLLLSLGTLWIYINIFFTPFYIWSEGVYKPWLFLNGFVLFRDLMWNRAGFDLYLLAGFYKIFGVNPLNFQIFIFLSQALIGAAMFLLLLRKSFKLATLSYAIYSLFAFLVYGSINQPAEILLGLFVFLAFYSYWEFLDTQKLRFILLAGAASGFSLITKQTSFFIVFSFFFFLFSGKKFLTHVKFYFLGLSLPVLGYTGYFFLNNALFDLYFNTIYVVLGPYRQNAPLWGLSEGLKMLAFHLSILIPFIFIKVKNIPNPIKVSLIMLTISLFFTLLPSFWSYRLISDLPLFSIITAIFFLHTTEFIKKNKSYMVNAIIILGFTYFLTQFGLYFRGNTQYIQDNGGYISRKYLLDSFSDNEFKVVKWIKDNTNKNERIFNISDNLILFYSNRFPQNKYDCTICFGYYPESQYYETITKNPSRIVIYDSNLPNDWPLMRKWQYAEFLKKYYNLEKKIGSYEIYVKKI